MSIATFGLYQRTPLKTVTSLIRLKKSKDPSFSGGEISGLGNKFLKICEKIPKGVFFLTF
jgi:hypothetical protein